MKTNYNELNIFYDCLKYRNRSCSECIFHRFGGLENTNCLALRFANDYEDKYFDISLLKPYFTEELYEKIIELIIENRLRNK